jgi:hypothetical protein
VSEAGAAVYCGVPATVIVTGICSETTGEPAAVTSISPVRVPGVNAPVLIETVNVAGALVAGVTFSQPTLAATEDSVTVPLPDAGVNDIVCDAKGTPG